MGPSDSNIGPNEPISYTMIVPGLFYPYLAILDLVDFWKSSRFCDFLEFEKSILQYIDQPFFVNYLKMILRGYAHKKKRKNAKKIHHPKNTHILFRFPEKCDFLVV